MKLSELIYSLLFLVGLIDIIIFLINEIKHNKLR